MKYLKPVLAFVFLAFILTSGMRIPIGKTLLQKECSPPEFKYDGYAPYCVGVIRVSYWLSNMCKVSIIKEQDDIIGGYGVGLAAPDRCNNPVVVQWAENGVTVSFNEYQATPAIDYNLFV